jgi:hypothetical protein
LESVIGNSHNLSYWEIKNVLSKVLVFHWKKDVSEESKFFTVVENCPKGKKLFRPSSTATNETIKLDIFPLQHLISSFISAEEIDVLFESCSSGLQHSAMAELKAFDDLQLKCAGLTL